MVRSLNNGTLECCCQSSFANVNSSFDPLIVFTEFFKCLFIITYIILCFEHWPMNTERETVQTECIQIQKRKYNNKGGFTSGENEMQKMWDTERETKGGKKMNWLKHVVGI